MCDIQSHFNLLISNFLLINVIVIIVIIINI
jgi:hypothetical protein